MNVVAQAVVGRLFRRPRLMATPRLDPLNCGPVWNSSNRFWLFSHNTSQQLYHTVVNLRVLDELGNSFVSEWRNTRTEVLKFEVEACGVAARTLISTKTAFSAPWRQCCIHFAEEVVHLFYEGTLRRSSYRGVSTLSRTSSIASSIVTPSRS